MKQVTGHEFGTVWGGVHPLGEHLAVIHPGVGVTGNVTEQFCILTVVALQPAALLGNGELSSSASQVGYNSLRLQWQR